MSTALTKPKKKPSRLKQKIQELKRKGRQIPSHTPNYITILPVGRIIEEKISEMGIDIAELARRMELPVETVEQLLRFEIPLTQELAEKVEKATQMPANVMMRFEAKWREAFAFAMEHPEIPAYLGEEIINRPKKRRQETEDRS